MVAGPFYLAVGLAQAFVRDGFEFSRHPLSVLANGPGGWIQTANFAIAGLMVLAAAIFPADPVDGSPPARPKGFPHRSAPPDCFTSSRVPWRMA